jgi:hypothetical protein
MAWVRGQAAVSVLWLPGTVSSAAIAALIFIPNQPPVMYFDLKLCTLIKVLEIWATVQLKFFCLF